MSAKSISIRLGFKKRKGIARQLANAAVGIQNAFIALQFSQINGFLILYFLICCRIIWLNNKIIVILII